MGVDRCIRRRIHGAAIAGLFVGWVLCSMSWAVAQEKERPAGQGGFGEASRGDVPEGTAEMMTPETDRGHPVGPGLAGPQPEHRRLVRQRRPIAGTSR